MQDSFLGDNLLSVIFLITIIFYAVAAIRKITKEEDNAIQGEQTITEQPDADRLVFYGNKPGISDEDIEDILIAWQPYYKNLQPFLQQRFRERIKEFMQQKIFVIHSGEGYKEMPVLTSAAAIQVSFGFDDFMLPWFATIEIFPDEFFDGSTDKIVNGIVDGRVISIAWNQFLTDNSDYTDRKNVGIHEMAHALYYQKIVVNNNDENFKSGFATVMQHGEKIYVQRGREQTLFADYAYKNLQEFWAESVAMFFEDPESMRVHYGDLFSTLKILLNQNPANSVNPVL